jgi:hypothetical protein
MKIIIYSPIISARIKYIFSFIFISILKTEISFTDDKTFFLNSTDFKINYSAEAFADELFFKSKKFLLSKNIENTDFKTAKFADYTVPFATKNSALPFDVFAASFFILSRYEEYLHYQNSTENFQYKDSFQYKWKILGKPIIDEWALIIKNIILSKHQNFKFAPKNFTHQATVNLNLKPNLPTGILARSKHAVSSTFNRKENFLKQVFDNALGFEANTEKTLANLNENLADNTLFFVGFKSQPETQNTYTESFIYLKNKNIGLLRISQQADKNSINLKANLKIINENTDSTCNNSQQLNELKLPNDYVNLLSLGLNVDYSMGYTDKIGFRAGTATPFNWFDLQLDKATTLNVKPICICDIALQTLNKNESIEVLQECIDAVKLVNGPLYSSWQLKSLSKKAQFNKWNTLFEKAINYIGK